MIPSSRWLACCCLCAALGWAEDEPAPAPVEDEPVPALSAPMPVLVAAHAEAGRLDASGKLWVWRVHKFPQDPRWRDPDRASIEKAWASAEPVVALGAELLATEGALTAWRVNGGRALWLYDGKTWRERALAPDEGTLDGSAAAPSTGGMLFGTRWGVLAVRGDSIAWLPVLPAAARAKETPETLRFVQDQAGAWYVYAEAFGSLWRVQDADGGKGFLLREIPVLDSVLTPCVGLVARHPDGTKERPQLLAGGLLLEKDMLDPPAPASEKETADLARALDSETFQDRERAAQTLRDDGAHGAWRYSAFLLNANVEKGSPEFRSQIVQAILDRVRRFEPGRSALYADKLARMGVLDLSFAKYKSDNYKNLWIALEEKGYWSRETRVGFERDRHEAHQELRALKDRVHNRFVMPFPVSGEWNQFYACKELYDEVEGVAWSEAVRDAWEEPGAKTLWLAMGEGGVWRVTGEAAASRSLHGFSGDAERGHLNAQRVLGRDAKGRLLVLGMLHREVLEDKVWKEALEQRGVFALSPPNAEPKAAPEPNQP